MHQPRRNPDGGVAPLPEGLGGLVLHGDRLAGMDDFDGQVLGIAPGKFRAEAILRPHQQDLREARAGSLNRSLNFRLRRRVGAHGIHSNASHGGHFIQWNLAGAG